MCIFVDFIDFIGVPDPDPEVLMPMAERSEILFQQCVSSKYHILRKN
jgi:hypothetical protein